MNIGNKIRDTIKGWLFQDGGGYIPMGSYSKTQEYNVWYEGDEQQLARYYSQTNFNENDIKVKANYLYNNAYSAERILHSGIPRLISDTMARILFSGGVDLTVMNGEKEDEIAQETLKTILKVNKMRKKHQEGASIESAFGEFAYKLTYDSAVSEFVNIDVYKPTQYQATYDCDRLQQVIFIDNFQENKKEYQLKEIYGKGFIDYQLYANKGGKYEQVPLTYSNRTNELVRVEFIDTDIILAAVKTNKTVKGRSDYEGLISEFDSLDEAWSNFSEEMRNAKTNKYIPQRMINGNKLDPRMVGRYVLIETDLDSDQKIQYEQANLRTTAWSEAINAHLNNILMNVGLSPATIGLDTAGANASGESRRELEKASLRTRAERMELWEEFLSDFYELVLVAQDMLSKKLYKEYSVKVQFGEYIVDTISERVASVKDLLMLGVIDAEFALEQVYGDTISQEEKDRILTSLGDKVIE